MSDAAVIADTAEADRAAAARHIARWGAERQAWLAGQVNGYVVLVDYLPHADPLDGRVHVYDYLAAAEEAAVRIMQADESVIATPQLVSRYRAMLREQLRWAMAVTSAA